MDIVNLTFDPQIFNDLKDAVPCDPGN
jgi:hypothetical protein